jgi:hypothetical protein
VREMNLSEMVATVVRSDHPVNMTDEVKL